jgi:predicted PhzF superfamily epimerase YddE/YHI9
MQQELHQFAQEISTEELSQLLRLPIGSFLEEPFPQVVSTGLFDVMVGVKSVDTPEAHE